MEKTTDSNIAILITGYNNNKGYSDIISCSDKTLEQDIRSQKVSLKDFRFSLNIVAEGEQIYSIGFTRDWKVYSVYEAYGWSARKVMIGLSLYIRKGYELQGAQKEEVKKLLDELKAKYIRIVNYQLEGITPVGAESTAGLSIKPGTSIGSFHNGVYTRGKDGKGYYTYSGSETINKIFSNGYASELQGFREVYLISESVQYIKPLVEALPTITPKPISKDITIRFLEDGTQKEVQVASLDRVSINGESVARSPERITQRIYEQTPSLKIEIEDKRYEPSFPLRTRSSKDLLAQDGPYLDILLKPRLYAYTLRCVEAGTGKPIQGVLVQIEYDRNGEPVQYKGETDYSGQIHILKELTFGQSVTFKPIKYNGFDKNKKFKKEAFQRRIPQRVNSEKNEYTLELKPDEKPKPSQPKTNSQNAGYFSPHAQMGSGSAGGQKQLVFVFEPENVTPGKNNIKLSYTRNGQEFYFKESDYSISGNKLILNFQDANIDEIKLNVVNGKNYYVKEPDVLNRHLINQYTSGAYSRKVKLERKNGGPNALLKKIVNWKTLSALAALLIVSLVGFAIYKFVIVSDEPVDIETLKKDYSEQVNAMDSIFRQEYEGVDTLLSNAQEKNKEIKKEEERLSLSSFDQRISDNLDNFEKIKKSVERKIDDISEAKLQEDTSEIKKDLKSLKDRVDSLKKAIRTDLLDVTIPEIEEKITNKTNEEELEKKKRKARFKTRRAYIYGSLNSVKKLREYKEDLRNNRNNYLNAGVGSDRVTNTLALAEKRLEIKDAQYIIRCFNGVADCSKSYSNEEFTESIDLLKQYTSDENALMPSQRQELLDWMKENDLNKE